MVAALMVAAASVAIVAAVVFADGTDPGVLTGRIGDCSARRATM